MTAWEGQAHAKKWWCSSGPQLLHNLPITLLEVPGCCCDVEAVAFLNDFLDLNSLLGCSMVLQKQGLSTRCTRQHMKEQS